MKEAMMFESYTTNPRDQKILQMFN